jgi:hypothetical protein
MNSNLSVIIEAIGITKVAGACGVSPSAVHRWKVQNRLPRTDYTGETRYAELIAELHGGITADDLRKPRTEAA